MTDNMRNIEQKAAQRWRRRVWCVVLAAIAWSAVIALISTFIKEWFSVLILLSVVAGFSMRMLGALWNRKFILDALYKELDAPLYAAIIRHGKLYDASLQPYILGEYALGHYQHVIGLCTKKLNDPAQAKHRYFYLCYLANCYFDLGNDEKLREICEEFDHYMSYERPRKRERLERAYLRMAIHAQYVKGNYKECRALMWEYPPANAYVRVQRAFCEARFTLREGNAEAAHQGFAQVLADAPLLLHFAALARCGLAAIESGRDYHEAVAEATFEGDTLLEQASDAPSVPRNVRVLRVILFVLLALCIVVGALVTCLSDVMQYKQQKEYEAHMEEIRLAVEENFDEVEVLHYFLLEKDGEVADSMCICRTSEGIVVGSTYFYDGDDKIYFEEKDTFTYDFIYSDKAHVEQKGLHRCTTSAYYFSYQFCVDRKYIPASVRETYEMSVNGVNVYFSIIDVFLPMQEE